MLDRDIDKPLGQDRPSAAPGPKLSRKAVYAGVFGLLAVGASAAMVLREQPFRQPPVEVAAAEPAKPAAPPKPQGPIEETQSVTMAEPPDDGESESILNVGPSAETTSGVIAVRDPMDVRQNPRMAHVPDRDLIERTPDGPLPKIAPDGRRPFDVYSRKWSGARGTRVAIVIGGLGMSQTGTQQAIDKLQPEVTLAFAPQGNSLGRWMTAARRDGHELLMQAPMEPFDYPRVNPGRATLTVGAGPERNIQDLRWTLARTTNYTGVMNYMGARFTSDAGALEPVMSELGKRGLMYLDDGTSARSAAPQAAVKNGVPFAGADAVIDAAQERGAILDKLDELERIARAKGFAIGVGSAFDVTVDTVRSWVAEARKRGVEIVPVSAIADDPRRG